MIFTKIFPIVSIWEVREGREKSVAEVQERIRTYLLELESNRRFKHSSLPQRKRGKESSIEASGPLLEDSFIRSHDSLPGLISASALPTVS